MQRTSDAHLGNTDTLADALLLGTRCYMAAGTVMDSGANAKVATANAINYSIGGVMYSAAALAGIVLAGGVLAVSSFRYYLLSLAADGTTVTATAGNDNANAPIALPANTAPFGLLKVTTDSSHTFTPGTTALNAAGITAAVHDLSCLPGVLP